MNKESYGQRLKEIRQKYGSMPRDTASCLKSYDRQPFRNDTLLDGKCTSSKLGVENITTTKNYSENIDPFKTDLTRKSPALIQKEKQAQQYFDSFLYTQNKEERLKQIQKIRQSVAQSKKQTMEDWNRQAERSKSRQFQREKYEVLRERTNTYMQRNPEQGKFSQFKESTVDSKIRNRGLSYTSSKIESDLPLNFQLRRNYDYPSQDSHKYFQNRSTEAEAKKVGYVRNGSVSKFDKEMEGVHGGVSFGCTTSIELNSARPVEVNTSPIRGLMKLDSLEKPIRVEAGYNPQNTVAKFATTTYDISNIDKIQQRIQKILTKK